jgi:hypothetical protein
MQNTFPWSVLGAALLLSACHDTTEPTRESLELDAKISSNDTECNGALTGTVFGDVVVPPGVVCVMTDAIVHGDVTALEGSGLVLAANNIVMGNVEGEMTIGFDVIESVVHGDVKNRGGHHGLINLTRLPNGNIELEGMTGGVELEGNTLEKGNVRLTDNAGGVSIIVHDNSVAGNVRVLKNLVSEYDIVRNGIGGLLEVSKNEARDVGIVNNTVAKDLEVFMNVAGQSIGIFGNTVEDDLECRKNIVPLFVAQGNSVGGKAEGQCASGTV